MYQALIAKNCEYEGMFYVVVKTTDIFCRPTCLAQKPKFESCEFFMSAQEALLASFRPCMRCRPLSHPNEKFLKLYKVPQDCSNQIAIIIPCHRIINNDGTLGGYGGGLHRKQ